MDFAQQPIIKRNNWFMWIITIILLAIITSINLSIILQYNIKNETDFSVLEEQVPELAPPLVIPAKGWRW